MKKHRLQTRGLMGEINMVPFIDITLIEENGGVKLLGTLPHISSAVLFLYAFIAGFILIKL